MKIIVTPHDLIERCLWFDYAYYILKDLNPEQKAAIVRENKEFEISERDAYIIRLLKCIHTDNLKHKMNEYLLNIVDLKHVVDESVTTKEAKQTEEGATSKTTYRKLISRDLMLDHIARFRRQFPDAYQPDVKWSNAIKDVEEYTQLLQEKIMTLQTSKVPKMQDWLFVNVVSFKKILSKHHG